MKSILIAIAMIAGAALFITGLIAGDYAQTPAAWTAWDIAEAGGGILFAAAFVALVTMTPKRK